tara:strand:- start:71 stop:247 length:177 start_codon:yes stop_codon:yes gene_type:complete
MDIADILSYIEHIIEGIEYEELDLTDVKDKLEELTRDLEDNLGTFGRDDEEFNFDDLM